MSKKKKDRPVDDGTKTVLVDGKDQKRIAELSAAIDTQANMRRFLLQSYMKPNEMITQYNPETGNITIRTAPKAPEPPKMKVPDGKE